MMEEVSAANAAEVHLSPELTQLSFEMSKNYFLDYILRDKQGRRVFMQFLHTQHCAENLMFWYDVEKYSKITDELVELRKTRANELIKKYISSDSPYEVNLPHNIKHDLLNHQGNPTQDMFLPAQRSIFLLMVYGTFDYFLRSERYRLYKATRDRGILDEDAITDEQLEAALKAAKHKALMDQVKQKGRSSSDRHVRDTERSRKLTGDKKGCIVS